MTQNEDLVRYVRLMGELLAGSDPPRELQRARALQRIDAAEGVEDVAAHTGIARRHLLAWQEALDTEGLAHWLGKKSPDAGRLQRAKAGIAQMVLGQLAEEHFEALSTGVLGTQGFRVEDHRVGRTDTDYRLVDPDGRGVCRLNIKFHGTLFKQAREYVGLEPADCFALATYKIHAALQKQEQERLPFVFLIISVPDVPRDVIERNVDDEWTWLASLSGRTVEESIAKRLTRQPWCEGIRAKIEQSEFRVISARRAYGLLRDVLFARVHALRLRGFNNLFRGAEINMHLSLGQEMIPYSQFLTMLADRGALEVALRLDRGEI